MRILSLNYKGLASIIMGAVQMRKGAKKAERGRKMLVESDKLFPEYENQEQRFNLNRIQSKRDSMYSGSYASTLMDNLNQNYANVTEGAMSLGSGGGSDVTALMQQGKTASQAFNQVLGLTEKLGFDYEQEANKQLGDIVQRKLELELMKHQEKRYDANSLIAAGETQNNAGAAAVLQGVEDIKDTAMSVFLPGGSLAKSAKGGRTIARQ